MRSEPIAQNSSVIKVLKLGDSVVSGGTLTDQDSISSYILERKLNSDFKDSIQVLNISAGSWGPDNIYAYLNKHGSFGAKAAVLVLSSHDLYDTMTHEPIVGYNVSYPGKRPLTAIGEVIGRYLLPRLGLLVKNESNLQINAQSTVENPGIKNLIEYFRKNNIYLVVYLFPTLEEVKAGEYNMMGKRIKSLLEDEEVPLIEGLNVADPYSYRDNHHPNERGQRIMANAIEPTLKKYIKSDVLNR